MIVTKELLKSFNLFDNLPADFKTLSEKEKYFFYYVTDEEKLELIIGEDRKVLQINISLYKNIAEVSRGMQVMPKLGYFGYTNESRDGLFFLFLRTFNDKEAVNEFYKYAKSNDEQINFNITTGAYNEIRNSDDFQKAIGYFCKGRLQTIMFVYDLVDAAFRNRLSRPLYGNSLVRVVNIIKYEAGVLSEIGGTFRYMVIGEKAILNDSQKAELSNAKMYLRQGENALDIYTKTGWAFSTKDGKWRTNISDSDAIISDIYLFDYQSGKLYIPEGSTEQSVAPLISAPEKLYTLGYTGSIFNVLRHPTLYNYYPALRLLPLIYYKNDKYPSHKNSFYQAKNDRGGYINICGNEAWGSHLSILLHEIQHAVQGIEGFAQGGNQNIAEFVSSVGAESVRSIFASMKRFEAFFNDSFRTAEKSRELLDLLKSYETNTKHGKRLKEMLLKYMNDFDVFQVSKTEINFYLILLIVYEGDFSFSPLVDFLAKLFTNGEIMFYELLNNIQDGFKKKDNYVAALKSQGISDDDIPAILHTNYENLYGELESRSVQVTRTLEGTYRNYFYLTSWEKSPNSQVTIIDGREKVVDVKNIVAAVERKGNEYALHFDRGMSSVPYLHELGHIVHDALVELGYSDIIQAQYDAQMSIADIDEYFVYVFMAYLKDRIEDDDFRRDMSMNLSRSNQAINEILDAFFADNQAVGMLEFLQNVLEL